MLLIYECEDCFGRAGPVGPAPRNDDEIRIFVKFVYLTVLVYS